MRTPLTKPLDFLNLMADVKAAVSRSDLVQFIPKYWVNGWKTYIRHDV